MNGVAPSATRSSRRASWPTRQRQVSEQAGRAVSRSEQDASRRLAGEQQQLAERADALGQRLDQLGGEGGDKPRRTA